MNSIFSFLNLSLKPEFALTPNDAKQLESITDAAVNALGQYEMQSVPFLRYGKLLLGLRRLAALKLGMNLERMLKPLVDNYILED